MENEEKKQVVSRLVKEGMEMITACFDEYYFVIPEGLIKPVPANAKVYHVGESVPVKGETYEFPDDFDILDLHSGKTAKIRGARLYDIVLLEGYEYDGRPALNMMGFAIKLKSPEDLAAFKSQYKTFSLAERSKLAAFANRWFEITKYRNIRYM